MRPALILTLSRNRESQQTSPTTTSRVQRQQRIPLQPRDHNALVMRAGTPLSTKSGNAMPYDKQSLNGPTRPILGGSAVKSANKAPLTPRIAGGRPLSTPRARQDGTPTSSQRDCISTPISSFLTSNITPRSSSRKSRVDSEHNTPTGSPVHEPLRVSPDTPVYNGGLGISDLDTGPSSRGPFLHSPPSSDLGSQRDQSRTPSTNDSKFFFADDAKPAAQASWRPPLTSKTSTSGFMYANGDAIPPITSSASAVGSSVGDDRSQPKFFQPPVYFPPPTPTVSTSSHCASPRLMTQSPNNSPLLHQRPTSPQKPSDAGSFSALKNVSNLSSSPVLGRPTSIAQRPPEVPVRRVSIKTPPRVNGNEISAGARNSSSIIPLRRLSVTILPSPEYSGPAPDIVTTNNFQPLKEDSENGLDNGNLHTEIQNPSKSDQTLERMNELAANARRERKVLDLEITNSSLAAINRTLEREMRKQTAELRRFRRLSRSGRLSIATTRTSSLSIIDGGEGTQLSDMSEEEDEDDETSEDESIDDGSLSPRAMAESDARHRKKDEKRLQLDLSKHQQLLVDSQKMNQSLKRCLGWTEELINEGKKALAYHVRVSDVELGGRVLVPDEEDEEEEDQSQPNKEEQLETGAAILGPGNEYVVTPGDGLGTHTEDYTDDKFHPVPKTDGEEV